MLKGSIFQDASRLMRHPAGNITRLAFQWLDEPLQVDTLSQQPLHQGALSSRTGANVKARDCSGCARGRT
ncbi:hypothetical protein KCP73_23490 [Salmonella enterica subsp. enterica]|nr:hypothetical protein KCP73_23490 [Salmonella enterica subsp. enterica]